MCLQFAFLLITRVTTWLRLSRREEAWQTAEILILRSQAEAILACDFFSVDLLDGTQAYVLTVIGHAARRIRILGVTLHPTGEWTTQQARNLIMDLGGQAERMKFMTRDRGSNFTAAFDAVLADAGIRTVLCNVRTPRMNAIAERWIGGCRPDRAFVVGQWPGRHPGGEDRFCQPVSVEGHDRRRHCPVRRLDDLNPEVPCGLGRTDRHFEHFHRESELLAGN